MSIDHIILNRKHRLCSLHFEDKMLSNFQKNIIKLNSILKIFQHSAVEVPIVEKFQISINYILNSGIRQSCSTIYCR